MKKKKTETHEDGWVDRKEAKRKKIQQIKVKEKNIRE